MKSLKIKNILLWAFAATTLLSSCSDYLDKLPENKVDEEKVQEENKEIVEAAQEISTKPE